MDSLKSEFRPELLNRLDNIIVFHPLSREQIGQIIAIQLDHLKNRLAKDGYKIDFSPQVNDILTEKGYEPSFGARQIRRAIAEQIENPLSEAILSGQVKKNRLTVLRVRAKKIIFSTQKTEAAK